jgi:DNA-binding response OmpR family regulator
MPPNKNSSDAILLVEPDVLIRTTLGAYLRDCGYVVIEVGDGTEGIAVLKHYQYAIKAMLTDAELPGTVDGFSLAQWARNNHPDVKTLIAASPEKAAGIAGNLCDEGPLLSKPYAPEIVADRIRQLLAVRSRGDA